MSSFHWDRRALIVIIFGAVTAVLWMLCIWQLILRFKPEISPTSPSPCEHGTYENEVCLCPEEWTGQYCQIVNFCDSSSYISSSENITFSRIVVGHIGYSEEKCENSTANAGIPKAGQKCYNNNGKPTLADLRIVNCSRNMKTLMDELNNADNSEVNISSIASDVQILTSVPQKLTTENISTAADIAKHILESPSMTSDDALAAVATVSQLLDANVNQFNFTDNNLVTATASLTSTLEKFSLSGSAVQTNIAVCNLSLTSNSTTALFSAQKGPKSSQSDCTHVRQNVSTFNNISSTEVQILINVTGNNSSADRSIGFVLYQNDKFFQAETFKSYYDYSKRVISGYFPNATFSDVQIVFSPPNNSLIQLHNYACVFWDYKANDWNTTGCKKESSSLGLRCRCNHLTSFAVLMSFQKKYRYAKPLVIISHIGTGFSIAGLIITIVFLILTRKTRKFSVTWMLVNLCTSMLIFYLIFISGIENSNAKKKGSDILIQNVMFKSDQADTPESASCTAVAVLLHYFLLATFMWTALNSAQLYLLLLKTLNPIPGHFILITSVIGWGLPAVVVAITFGATYKDGKPLQYRQEEFCWLAALDEQGNVSTEKPMIWSFLLIVALILLINIVIFVKIIVSVMWKDNMNLTSNRKRSFRTKIVGTLSIAVVLGITWVLGYMMLIGGEEASQVFSILFCIFNTTQGLQICILYTFRSPIFKKKITEMFSYVSMPDIPIHLHSKTYYFVKFRGYKKHADETVRPSETFSEETTFSNSDPTR
ncbi:adhesion G-protein coupled receptor G7 [Carettochelys insculpta]|uniref:adhesion G-protein coupled receptor G7 n=1 Tax=Carettochelys insculpta TaxID=44489 RepID=UPI003EB821FC